MITRIGDVVEFLTKYPQYTNKFSVLSRFGYKKIEAAAITAYDSGWVKTTLDSGKYIETSKSHLLLSTEKVSFNKVKELSIGDYVFTIDGPEKIVSMETSQTKEDLVDIQVEEVNEFYANEIVSHNSTIASLITFGLFGQVVKNITKPQIVNSINAKQCLVEIEFIANNTQYLVRRGIKPNIFDIFENGKLLEQTLSNDHQEYLEKNIIKTNFKTFLQTAILSVENYKPFMTLRTYERRAFIEEILDIKVFTFMNQILKSKMTKNKEELRLLEIQLKNSFAKAKMQKQHIEQIESIKNANTEQIKTKIIDLDTEKANLVNKNLELNKILSSNNTLILELNKKSREHQLILTRLDQLEKTIGDTVNKMNSVADEDICPVCNSEIHESTKCNIVDPLKKLIDDTNEKKQVLIDKLAIYNTVADDIINTNALINTTNSEISTNNIIISKLNAESKALSEEVLNVSKMEELADMKAELKQTASEALKYKQSQADVSTEQQYNEMMIELFKDSGIKSKIVDQYIPIINNLINLYLEKLDFFVSFNLDSEFNETIKSRHRDDFTYGSFSAGERTKIDIALLFTFRQLSKIRNSFDCNLLFIDEILEFLDENGTTNFLSMIDELDEFKKSNIFIISHKLKEQLAEVFDGHLLMHKESGFSLVTDLSK